jgi:putative oxidoreductase
VTSRPRAGLLVVRVTLGVILASHGFSKMFLGFRELFVGPLTAWGFPAPELVAWWVTLVELVGATLLALGVAVRPLAAYFFLHIGLGIVLVHSRAGWYTVGPGRNGVEFSVLILAACAALVLAGREGTRPEPADQR